MGLGTGAINFEAALFLLCQKIAEWGLCVCMPRLHRFPHSLYGGRKNMPDPQGKGHVRPWEGKMHSVDPSVRQSEQQPGVENTDHMRG